MSAIHHLRFLPAKSLRCDQAQRTFCAALAAVAFLLWHANAQAPKLCENGRPVHRGDHVTYGGLPPRYGFERDRRIPLCLGGPATRENVQYESWPEAHEKDRLEWEMCEAFCPGEISLEAARATFQK
jgi:hypothetical protein